jgi:2-keto-4-pentenoate hydratase/2-oxohepta-3-ene-1,7-dioic acid hydratase in catechol pathway
MPAPLKPSKIICVGLNYVDHAEEVELPLPTAPLLFAKWPNALCGDGDEIVIPEFCTQVDYEAELGLVVGRAVRDVAPEDALACLAGVTCVNDVSARDCQFADGQWTRGKSFDTFCPVGPTIVPIEQVGDLGALSVRCLLNGEVVQDSSTAQLIFPVEQIVAYVSRHIQLLPGDLICTGTPAGVGMSARPPRFLRHGDEVVVEVGGVGTLSNRVVEAGR